MECSGPLFRIRRTESGGGDAGLLHPARILWAVLGAQGIVFVRKSLAESGAKHNDK
jgi:hypothetical protein